MAEEVQVKPEEDEEDEEEDQDDSDEERYHSFPREQLLIRRGYPPLQTQIRLKSLASFDCDGKLVDFVKCWCWYCWCYCCHCRCPGRGRCCGGAGVVRP